ncbi:hypothetical protein ACFYMW_36085 [Streptomyces sp. NPDC006692]|uniref:hypothetical protein n=1 Tax=unclassified Streptomyces TaxID=2593676 RepID=UPI0034297837
MLDGSAQGERRLGAGREAFRETTGHVNQLVGEFTDTRVVKYLATPRRCGARQFFDPSGTSC